MSELAKLHGRLTGLSNDVADVQKPVNRIYAAARIAKATLAAAGVSTYDSSEY